MSPLRFGTDGVRGVANADLTAEFALALGRSTARHLKGETFLVGRDTRQSGPMLEAALSAGLAAEGRDVVHLGVIPTPGVAYLAVQAGLPAAMISASHNPYSDNGIKLFGRGGTKLSRDDEEAIEQGLGEAPAQDRSAGGIVADPDGLARYCERLVAVLEGAAVPQAEVVVDCANGAASVVAPAVLEAVGVSAHLINAAPDGTNINAGCGSTDLGPLIDAVRSRGAGLGIAFDGDADRMLAVDHTGRPVDGDHLIAMFAADMHRRDALDGATVVVTVLSNVGLRKALNETGIQVIETPVGDRHVADALDSGGYSLGGEQSGHLIFRRHASTGDGLLTALLLLELLGRTGSTLADLAGKAMERVPQVLVNVSVPDTRLLEGAPAVWEEAGRVERILGDEGRVLLRSSGTESCVRVMVEAPTPADAEQYAEKIAAVVRRELG